MKVGKINMSHKSLGYLVCCDSYAVHKQTCRLRIKLIKKANSRPIGYAELQGVVKWSLPGVGIGEFVFTKKGKKTICNNEYMPKETIKKILCQAVDECELKDK